MRRYICNANFTCLAPEISYYEKNDKTWLQININSRTSSNNYQKFEEFIKNILEYSPAKVKQKIT